jgi:hypothetical protein
MKNCVWVKTAVAINFVPGFSNAPVLTGKKTIGYLESMKLSVSAVGCVLRYVQRVPFRKRR